MATGHWGLKTTNIMGTTMYFVIMHTKEMKTRHFRLFNLLTKLGLYLSTISVIRSSTVLLTGVRNR